MVSSPAELSARPAPSWLPIAILASAQFVMVLDSSVMNVSISQIVADLDTTIQGVQLAITAYTLVMAAFMLAGAKLGDILGRQRTFAIGLAVYGLGSLTTALSPNLGVLLIGWSLIEGLGAALVMPAIVSLVAATYSGSQRALAFGIIGGVAGAAVAVGPLIGGWVTTELSWRYVFAAETVVVILILLLRNRLQRAPRDRPTAAARPRRRRPVVDRPRAGRLRHPQEQFLGPDRAARRAHHRRRGDHAVRVLDRPVRDPGGPRVPGRLRAVGGAP